MFSVGRSQCFSFLFHCHWCSLLFWSSLLQSLVRVVGHITTLQKSLVPIISCFMSFISCGHIVTLVFTDNVIDNEDNWNGYLLSKRILQLDDFHYPLTVHQAMIDCDEAKTAWTVFHLDKKWDLDTLLNFTDTLDAHLDDVTKVEAPSVNLLGGETNTAMQNLRDAEVMSVKWQDCLNAAIAAVYAGTTGNFTRLRETMLILVCPLSFSYFLHC